MHRKGGNPCCWYRTRFIESHRQTHLNANERKHCFQTKTIEMLNIKHIRCVYELNVNNCVHVMIQIHTHPTILNVTILYYMWKKIL